MSGDMPQDPMTDLAASATQLHELYQAYVDAGFNEQQAMRLVCEILRNGMQQER
jgi:hypothetical protein